MSDYERGTSTQSEEQLAREKLDELLCQHRAMKQVIVMIHREMSRLEVEIWNHGNRMGEKGWHVDLKYWADLRSP